MGACEPRIAYYRNARHASFKEAYDSAPMEDLYWLAKSVEGSAYGIFNEVYEKHFNRQYNNLNRSLDYDRVAVARLYRRRVPADFMELALVWELARQLLQFRPYLRPNELWLRRRSDRIRAWLVEQGVEPPNNWWVSSSVRVNRKRRNQRGKNG